MTTNWICKTVHEPHCENCLYYRRHYICREGYFFLWIMATVSFPAGKNDRRMLSVPTGP